MRPTPACCGDGEDLVDGLEAERVGDDLHGGDVRPRNGRERLVDALDADAVRRDGFLLDQGVEGVEHRVVGVDRGRRAVQLDQVEDVDAEVAARPVGPGAEVLQHVVLRHLVHPAAHLGGHRDGGVGPVGEEAADDRLAATVAVHVGGVEEGHPVLDGRLEHGPGVLLRDVTPVRAQLPRAQSHHGDLSSGPAQSSLLHDAEATGRAQACGAAHVGRFRARPGCTLKCPRPVTAGRAPVAQRIEHLTTDQKVRGSNPFRRAQHGAQDNRH